MSATTIDPKEVLAPVRKDGRDLVLGMRIYELSYKKTLMVRTRFLAKDKQEAIQKGREFCTAIHATFCGVDDFLADLDELAERKKRGDE